MLTATVAAALVASFVPGNAQASAAPTAPAAPEAGDYWTPASARPRAEVDGHSRRVNPSDYAAFTLDGQGIRASLARAPEEGSAAASASPLTVAVPAPTGELMHFEVSDSPIMEPRLAARHPEISTYAGRGVEDPSTSIRLDVTPMGFHASVLSRAGGIPWYVDPAYNGDDRLYLSYFGADLPETEAHNFKEPVGAIEDVVTAAGPGPDVTQRTYRLALLTDPSYATYFGSENVLAEKVTLMNRVNQVYNDDLAVKMVLIDETDKLNIDTDEEAFGANGPCGSAPCFSTNDQGVTQIANGCTGSLLTRNRIVLGQLIGASNYDIGHIGLGINGGGIASLGVVGGASKGQGCTGLPQPEGDFFAVDYVAHEMGHQFAGSHTFNGNQWNCAGGNRSAANSVEPGSGSSVMAYAGICQQDNLQPHSDPYFSQRSIQQITTYVTSERPAINEVQTVSLRNFNVDGESFALTYNGRTTDPIVRGVDYSPAGIKAELEAILPEGAVVTVAGWGNSSTFNDTGFQVTFSGTLAGTNLEALTLEPGLNDVAGFVGETNRGGAIQNGGHIQEVNGNHAPVVTAPAAKTIPIRTPFTLTGSGTDVDGDTLTYSWEQNDRGGATGTALVNNTKTDGPLFRMFEAYAPVTPAGTLVINSPGENHAGTSPSRTFPDMAQILVNNTNATTGACPAAPEPPASGGATNVPVPTIECFAEFLPTADYVGYDNADGVGNADGSLNFRLTARDSHPDGGGTSFGDVKLMLDKTAGPFLVSVRNAAGSAAVGTRTQPVTWAVNGTNTPALAENVRISLSVDGGKSFPRVLAESTPNDGTQLVQWPNVETERARIKIEAVGNYFFDVNDADFSIVPVEEEDEVAPETRITGGPGRFLLDNRTTISYASSEEGSSFRCALDARSVDCGNSSVTLGRLSQRTHTFAVAARDEAGNVDRTPAARTWTVPVNDRRLAKDRAWTRATAPNAYLGTFSVARRKGAMLTYQVTDARQIVLVAATGRSFGNVRVYLDGELLRRISTTTDGALRARQVLEVRKFARPTSGEVTIVTADATKVRVEGLGVVTRAPEAVID
jgi:hypothetical protein